MPVTAIGSAPNVPDVHVVPSATFDLIATRDLATSGFTTIFPPAGGVLVVAQDGQTVYTGDSEYNIDLFSPQGSRAAMASACHIRTISSRVTDPYFASSEKGMKRT